MRHERFVRFAALTLCVCATACTQTPTGAESSALECSDHEDDDGDDLADCFDPDCWGHAACRLLGDAGGFDLPPAFMPPDDNSSPDNVTPPMLGQDAAVDDTDMTPVDGPDLPEDAGSALPPPPELPCDGRCAADACHNEVCTVSDPGALGTFRVLTVAANVPRELEPFACFDAPLSNDACLAAGGTTCCDPDLQVVVLTNNEKDGSTPLQRDVQRFEWSAPDVDIQLVLRTDDEVTLTAVDVDLVGGPQEIMTCSVVASSALLATGELSCTKSFALQPVGGLAEFSLGLTLERVDTPQDDQGQDEQAL